MTEFEDACRDFVAAEKAFNACSQDDVCRWFDLLEERYLCEKRLWQMFIGGDRSLRTGHMYLAFREMLCTGKPLRVDA